MNSPNTVLYSPDNKPSGTTLYAFFVVDNTIENEALLAFKSQTQASLLIALNTQDLDTSNPPACLAVADTVIYCKADEVDMVVEVFGKFFTGDTFISIDKEEVVDIFKNQPIVYFTHAQGIANNTNEKIDNAVKIAVEEIFTHTPLKAMCVLLEGSTDMGFEEYVHLTSAVSEYPYSDEMDIFYGLNLLETAKSDNVDMWIFGIK